MKISGFVQRGLTVHGHHAPQLAAMLSEIGDDPETYTKDKQIAQKKISASHKKSHSFRRESNRKVPKGLNPDVYDRAEQSKRVRQAKYNTREWRELKNLSDMDSDEAQSVYDSDNDDDYLVKGLNWHNKGDLSHLPPKQQIKAKKQNELARKQGAMKFIPVLKGQRMQIKEDMKNYITNERKQYCPVEFYHVDKNTHRVVNVHQFLNLKLKTTDEEKDAKANKILQQVRSQKEKDERRFHIVKYQAE